MDDKTRSEILTEAERIGDNLLTIAHRDENGMTWNITTIEKDNSLTDYKLEDIFTGAAGIGLTRLRAFELLKKPIYEQEAKNAIARAMRQGGENEPISPMFTLSEGETGNAELFLQSAAIFKNFFCLSRFSTPILVVKGYGAVVEPVDVYPGEKGDISIGIRELERLEIQFSGVIVDGYQLVFAGIPGKNRKNLIISYIYITIDA
jgi:hypothetical protein